MRRLPDYHFGRGLKLWLPGPIMQSCRKATQNFMKARQTPLEIGHLSSKDIQRILKGASPKDLKSKRPIGRVGDQPANRQASQRNDPAAVAGASEESDSVNKHDAMGREQRA